MKRANRKQLRIGDYVVFNNSGMEAYGAINAVNHDDTINIVHYKAGNVKTNLLTGCIRLSSFATEDLAIHKTQIIRRFAVVKDYINRFEVLDMTKL